MADADDIVDQIAEDALKSQSTTNDGVTITRRSLADQIAAEKHLRAQAALSDPDAFPLRMFKIAPPGGR